jgi:phosphoadenosine phosphosulfate reductase
VIRRSAPLGLSPATVSLAAMRRAAAAGKGSERVVDVELGGGSDHQLLPEHVGSSWWSDLHPWARNSTKLLSVMCVLTFFVLLRIGGFESVGETPAPNTAVAELIHFPVKKEDVARWNEELASKDADAVLRWIFAAVPRGALSQLTSFGPSGIVITHKLETLHLLGQIPVVTVDTLHLFPESYAYLDTARRTFPEMGLRVCRPKGFQEKMGFDREYGADLWHTDHEKYAQVSKIEPMLTCFSDLGVRAYITGRRRGQGGERNKLPLLELTDKGEVNVNPLAAWTLEEVWEYIKDHDLPYNPLYDAGYKSIGDTMTTAIVEIGGTHAQEYAHMALFPPRALTHIRTHLHTHLHTHTYTHLHTHTHAHTHTHTHIHTHKHTHTHTHTHTQTHTHHSGGEVRAIPGSEQN